MRFSACWRPWKFISLRRRNRSFRNLSAQNGRATDDLVEDAVAGYCNEAPQVREILDSRYDGLKSGRVKPIDGEKAYARLKAETEAQRKRPA